jgi:hypothetical protein
MASGIDMSARLISLAINIALMGFILLEGVLADLTRALSGFAETSSLRLLAEKVAAGNIAQLTQGSAELAAVDPHGVIVHAALVHGFERVMLYGAIGAWALAVLSAMAFGPPELVAHASRGGAREDRPLAPPNR